MRNKLRIYFSDGLNKLDILAIVLFITGMTIRFLPFKYALEAAHVVLAVNFISFCLRLLHIFSVHIKLGPNLVMIRKMLADLMYFIVILMVFVVSYAIASHSLLYPNSTLTWRTVVQVIRTAYWNIHGELFLDEIEGETTDCTFDEMLWSNGTYPRCPSDVGKVVVPIMLATYVLVTSVLLLNLLIAMFSYTFGKVQEETEALWCFHRYSLIREYTNRSAVCPPFVLLTNLFFLGRCIFAKCCKKGNGKASETQFKRKCDNEEYEQELIYLEILAAETYTHTLEKEAAENLNFKADQSSAILGRIEEQQRQLQSAHLETNQQIQRISKRLEKGNSGAGYLVPPTFKREKIRDEKFAI